MNKYLHPCSGCGKRTPRKTTRRYTCNECLFYKNSFHSLSKKIKSGSCCEICGDSKNLHTHHKDKNKHNDSLENLMVVCRQCHNSIHAHNLIMPKGVKWGKCGKRLIYKDEDYKPKQIIKDHRWGHSFIKKIKGQPTYLLN
jgi:hypothetical protein